jgi:hypothetical protein
MMASAGYDPNDSGAALERLGAFYKVPGGPFAKLAEFRRDHPFTADRVRHLRKLIAQKHLQSPEH